MIAYVKGEIIDIQEDNVVIECGNIGYNIKISASTAQMLPGIGENVKIFTYTCVREDAFILYGFLSKDDLEVFKKCITVNGIGPKGALAILSVMDADSLRFAILSGDAKAIAKAPGIGGKTAERLILDLRDKVKLEDTFVGGALQENIQTTPLNNQKKEAVEALSALGYSGADSLKAVNQVELVESMTVEDILKAALKYIY